MNLEQCLWQHGLGWVSDNPGSLAKKAQLVLVFGARRQLSQHLPELGLGEIYPEACIVGCSTAGEIHGTQALEESITVMAIPFRKLFRRTNTSPNSQWRKVETRISSLKRIRN